jgi:hypothetical protein
MVLVLAAFALASTADAGDGAWVETIVRDLNAPFGVDLSLSGNPFASSVRIPLGRHDEAVGTLTPYVSAGATDPTRNFDAVSGLLGRDVEASRGSQRLDVGAGLNWNLTDQLKLFGEVGFQRARSTRTRSSGSRATATGPTSRGASRSACGKPGAPTSGRAAWRPATHGHRPPPPATLKLSS